MALAELDGPGARAPRGPRARLAWALLPPAAAAFTFFPITRNYFVSDDFLHLLTFANDGLLRFLVTPFGGHVLVVRNLVFALCVRAFGTNPTGFFWTVLATHVVNAALLYLLLARVVGSRPVACLVALLWGAAPHHGVTLGWYSVYGEALCATLVLLTLLDVTAAADGAGPVSTLRTVAWALVVIAAATAFGVGIGVALVFPAAVILLIGNARLTAGSVAALWTVPVAVALVYVAIQRSAVVNDMPALKAVTQLVTPGWPVVAMWWCLVAYGTYALAAGPFVSATFFASPPGMLVAGAAVVALAVAIARAEPPMLRRLAAVALLALGAYGSIAAGRAVLYASIAGSVIKGSTEGRYHYIGQLFLAVLLAHVLLAAGRMLAPRVRQAAFAVALATALLGFLAWPPAIDHHDGVRTATLDAIARIDADLAAARAAAPDATSVTIENRLFQPAQFPEFVGTAGLFVIWFPTNVRDGRQVFFAAAPRPWRMAQTRGGRLAALVRPATAPPGS
jgi:hypothetical protein